MWLSLVLTLSLAIPKVYGVGPMDEEPSTEATPPSEPPTTSEYTTMPGCGGRLIPKDMIPALQNFREQLQMGQIVWKCDTDGNMVIASNPNREITVQSVLKNLGKPDPMDMFDSGFHAGYVYGMKAAQEGLIHLPKLTPSLNPDFSKGFDEGYHQGFDAYVVIKRAEAYQNLEK